MRQVGFSVREDEAQARAAEAVNKALEDYEKDASPEALELLEKAKQDPDFLAGFLQEMNKS